MFIIKPQSQFMYKNPILVAILNLAAILRHIAVILILKKTLDCTLHDKKSKFGFYYINTVDINPCSQQYSILTLKISLGAQTGILGTFFQKSANGIVFVEKNGSRINIKHKVNTISLMDRILRPTTVASPKNMYIL